MGVDRGYGVRVEGLARLRRNLKELDGELPKQLTARLKAIAETVAEDARSRVPVRTGRAQRSIKALASGSTAGVRGGQKSVPYYGWLDFGGKIVQRKMRRVLRREVIKGGRYMYPALAANHERVAKEALDAFYASSRDLDVVRGGGSLTE